jgi:Protein of unknown function (DUF3146)
MNKIPQTTAYITITNHSWSQGKIAGEVRAGDLQWQFEWCFNGGNLLVYPSQGRALIKEPLHRFLERYDYQLEVGSDYMFTIRGKI